MEPSGRGASVRLLFHGAGQVDSEITGSDARTQGLAGATQLAAKPQNQPRGIDDLRAGDERRDGWGQQASLSGAKAGAGGRLRAASRFTALGSGTEAARLSGG